MSRSDRRRGFTLLEMLVVLLIAGMTMALTSQALGQYQRAHTRVIASERGNREFRLSEAWFRESVRGLHAVVQEGPANDAAPPFSGDARGFTGVTLAPVLHGQGVPVVQRWRIERDGNGREHLMLDEEGKSLTLVLQHATGLRLHYLDREGELHDRWPPANGVWSQLPDVVVLELLSPRDGGDAVVASAVTGPRDPLPIPYEYAPE